MAKNKKNTRGYVAVVALCVFLFAGCKNPVLEEAKRVEAAGDLQTALSLYTEAAYTLSPSIQVPDVNRSKILSVEQLRKEVMKYSTALFGDDGSRTPAMQDALSGIDRCMMHGRHDVSATDPVRTEFTEETYLDAWNGTFFAAGVKPDPSHIALASGNMARNLSLLRVTCGKNYSYEFKLLNKKTLQSTRCLLPSENSVRLYVLPGEHLLLVRSTVMFPSGEIWKSLFTPIMLSIPDRASLIHIELRTSVRRK